MKVMFTGVKACGRIVQNQFHFAVALILYLKVPFVFL